MRQQGVAKLRGRFLTGALLALISVCLGWAQPAWAQTKFYGFDFADHARVAGQNLQLNGVGGRSVPIIFLRVFAAALYLPSASHDPEAIVKMDGAKRVQIRMAHGVGAQDFKKALLRGIEKNYSPQEQAAFAPRTQAFAAIIDSLEKVQAGDSIDLDFVPNKGLIVSVNGKAQGEPIAGTDFYAAVLRIFIGKRPAEQEMKERMLGLKK